mgnify:CR=1 FL=1
MTFDSLVLSKIHLQDVPKLSSFVDRSLKAMLPAGSDDERLHRLQDLAAAPWTRDRIVERVRGVTDSTQLAYCTAAAQARAHGESHRSQFNWVLRL